MIHCRLVRLGEDTGGSSEQLQQRGGVWKHPRPAVLKQGKTGGAEEKLEFLISSQVRSDSYPLPHSVV